MHESLQNILNLIEQSGALTAGQKQDVADWAKQIDKAMAITEFKLDRTEKVKRTTAILLEETIEELEQKRKAVEEQNRELEVEASLDRVRAEISSMRSTDDLQRITPLIWRELTTLGVPFFRCGVFII
ncbi:MAG: hypothetical protein HUU01_13075, partial [Saprospiraceae bacterium]|nr:hypothetical protein [Saprospiraceae bacterium]